MILDIVYLLVGLVLILVGANMLTDGAAAVAKKWGVSDLLIGLTVVAFGTSMPELVISVVSAAQGNAGLAIGNVVGGNIFNVCAIIGITAMVRPMHVERGLLTKDIPLVVLSSIALLAMGNSPLLDGTPDSVLGRVDGIILLLFFLIFLRHTFSQTSSGVANVTEGEREKLESAAGKTMPMWKACLWIVLGLAGLIFGGDWFVDGASGIASAMGVSEAMIGLTIVAVGTSLPELATCVVAARKGNADMAIGNIIGSSIFNAFFVLGCASVVRPLPFGSIGNFDLLALTIGSILFWVFGQFFRRRTVTRWEGALLTACYILYVLALILRT